MPSHVDPAIFVHANVGALKVTARAMTALGIKRPAAVGHLVMFWGQAAQLAPDGVLTNVDDELLEDWAGWKGKRGLFAAFIREHHLDPDGRPNEWHEYAGRLALQRQKWRDRQRTYRERSQLQSRDMSQRRHGDNGVTVTPSIEKREERIEKRERSKTLRADALPPESGEVAAHWQAKVGKSSPLAIHRALGDYIAAHGIEAVRKAIDVYASDSEGPGYGKPRKLDWFAGEFLRWHRIASMPTVVDGVLTERGRRAGGTA